ncbi:MAG TPA: PfkB family carbohydrate kinase, partial [Steroidobacteraceae bacterium]
MRHDDAPVRPESLLGGLDACVGREVWIVGDLMLDEYVSGPVERVSPEAPVPVVHVRALEYRLGGAANVARQVAALGARPVLGGVVGDDEAGRRLLADCASAGIDTRAVLVESSRPTTRKLRVLSHGQQLLRMDWEDPAPCPEAMTTQLLERLRRGAPPDHVILSDYSKGVLTDPTLATLIGLARSANCGVTVDPKRRDFTAYRGASLVTPNLNELAMAVGRKLDPDDIDAVVAAARPLVDAAQLEAMLVTLSDRGMLLVPASGPAVPLPALRRAVADVTGAGDTVVAVLGALLAGGARIEHAMTVANAAAALAVGEIGAVAIEPGHIRSLLTGLPVGKILGRVDLAARAAGWRMAGKRIVFTNGCFDLMHSGHLALLHEAARKGDVLVIAINSDESVRRLKGPSRPIVTADERAALLAA